MAQPATAHQILNRYSLNLQMRVPSVRSDSELVVIARGCCLALGDEALCREAAGCAESPRADSKEYKRAGTLDSESERRRGASLPGLCPSNLSQNCAQGSLAGCPCRAEALGWTERLPDSAYLFGSSSSMHPES